MPPKRGRPAKSAAAAPADPASEVVLTLPSTGPEEVLSDPPFTENDEVKEFSIRAASEPSFEYDLAVPNRQQRRQQIVTDVLVEEYRALVRERLAAGTLEVDDPEDRALLREIQELRSQRAPLPVVAAPAPAPLPVTVQCEVQCQMPPAQPLPVTVEVQMPAASSLPPASVVPAAQAAPPSEWAEEFGVLLSSFFQTERGVTLVDALERQTKVWMRVSQQLEQLNRHVASLIVDEEEDLEGLEEADGASLSSSRS